MQDYTKTVLPLIWMFFLAITLFGQSSGPYHLSFKRDVVYLGGGALSFGLGEYLSDRVPGIKFSDLKKQSINGFDRGSNTLISEKARKWSDYGLYASVGLSATLLAGQDTRNDFLKIGVLFAETTLINAGLTIMGKAVFRRPRPYVFDESWNSEQILSSNDQASFFSGHASGAAASTFFFATVFSDYYPDSKLKPYVWGVAMGLPALTGYLRIKAGKHFPSDVITGYLFGAGIGYLVPTLHKKPINQRSLTISPTGNGVYLAYRF